jgi:hypothetical protein
MTEPGEVGESPDVSQLSQPLGEAGGVAVHLDRLAPGKLTVPDPDLGGPDPEGGGNRIGDRPIGRAGHRAGRDRDDQIVATTTADPGPCGPGSDVNRESQRGPARDDG